MDPAEYPAEQLASGSRPVSRQSCSPAAPERLAKWIPRGSQRSSPVDPIIPPASGSRRVSHQSSPPAQSGEYPAEYVDHAEYPQHPTEYPLLVKPPVDPASIPPEQLASLVLLNVPPGARWAYTSCWCLRMCSAERGAGGGFCRPHQERSSSVQHHQKIQYFLTYLKGDVGRITPANPR